MRVRTGVGALLCVVGLLAACVPPDPPPTLKVTTSSLEPGVAGVPFRAVLEATGGTEPYTWTATGLPDGFELDPLGLIAGTPSSMGSGTVTVTVQDAAGKTATRQLTLAIPDSLPEECIESSCEDVVLADGVVEVPGGQAVSAETGSEGVVNVVVVSGPAPAVGQVVVFGESAALPGGYIAEVTASSAAAGGTRLEVVPSTIAAAYSEATIKAVPEASVGSALRSATALAVPSFECSGGVTVDSGSTTATASLTPSGVVQKNRPIFGSVEYIQVGVEGSITVSLDVGISGAATCTASLAPPPAVIGPVDLKLAPTLTLEVSGAAQLSTSVTLKCGVFTTWYPSKGASTTRWCHPSGQPLQFTGGAKASLTADLKPTVSLKGLIGLHGSVAPKITAEYTPPTAKISANWSGTLDLCVLCLLGDPWIEIRVLSYTSPSKVLWQSNSGPGTTTTTVPSGPLKAVHVDVGSYHACAAMDDGTVRCWGTNGDGQLGLPPTPEAMGPVVVEGATDAIAVAAGQQHSCALRATGSILCWGSNYAGTLGNGESGPDTDSPNPVSVSGINDAVHVDAAAGGQHTCAVLGDGAVKCWGQNASGQLGDDTVEASPTPVVVTGVSGAARVSVKGSSSCALTSSGAIRCWGSASDQGAPAATSVSVGLGHTCIVDDQSAVKCWGGSGPWGPIPGSGGLTNVAPSAPVTIEGTGPVAAVEADHRQGCALLLDETVRCWGELYGVSEDPPIDMGLGGVRVLSLGLSSACAATDNGRVYCWGNNTFPYSGVPTEVAGLSDP